VTSTNQDETGNGGSALSDLCGILLTGLQALADAGDADRACRLAGRACAAVRGANDQQWRRFNALLHRLAPQTGPVESQLGAQSQPSRLDGKTEGTARTNP
jgi:hypothetical protein